MYKVILISGDVVELTDETYAKFETRLTNSLRKQDTPFQLDTGSWLFPDKIAYILAPDPPIEVEVEPEEEKPQDFVEDYKEVADSDEDEEKCNHNNLPIGYTTTKQGIKRYHYYCEVCGYKSNLIRHSELPEDHSGFINLQGE